MRSAVTPLGMLALTGCLSAAPLDLPETHPANPKGSAGLIGTPTTLEGYKSSNDFAARAAQEADTPSGGHAHHGAHAGMQHGSAPAQPTPRR